MVDSLWAMTNDVLPSVRRSMASWMTLSVLVSTELVASSRISSGEPSTMARAMVTCCLCPADRLALSPRTVSYPSGSVWM